jgi:hypothetical protein
LGAGAGGRLKGGWMTKDPRFEGEGGVGVLAGVPSMCAV